MFNLFQTDDPLITKRYRHPQIPYLHKQYVRILEQMIDYYHTRVYTTPSNHLLNKIITTLSAPMQYDDYRYKEIIDSKAYYVAKTFNITTPLSPGVIHRNVFFNDIDEIIIYTETDYDPMEIKDNWRQVSPITILHHPYTSTTLNPLLPNKRPNVNGYAVIHIDLSLLKMMYRYWYKDQLLKNPESPLTTSHFTHMYPLANALLSYLNIAIINRAIKLYYNDYFELDITTPPMSVSNYDNKLDSMLIDTLSDMDSVKQSYSSYLDSIMTIIPDTALETLQLPDYPPTKQIHWSMVVSRLPYIDFLLDWGGDNAIKYNKKDITLLRIMFKRMRNDNVFKSIASDYIKDYSYTVIDKVNKI